MADEAQQWTRADLAGKTPEEIQRAKADGLLEDLRHGRDPSRPEAPPAPEGQYDRQTLKGLSPAEVVAAAAEGKLNWLLSGGDGRRYG